MLRRLSTTTSLYSSVHRNSLSHSRVLPISFQAALRCSEPTVKKEEAPPYRNVFKYQVRPIDKFFLVATRVYKNTKDIPPEIDLSTMAKAEDRRRISVSIFLCLFCAVGCYAAFKRGQYVMKHNLEDSLTQQNLKRDERNRAAAAAERAKKAEAEAEAAKTVDK